MRRFLLVALLAASCSYPEETADVFLHVDGIPQGADRLLVVVTPNDATVSGKNCGADSSATNATCYRPSFQPVEPGAPLRSLDLAFAAPAPAGTFTVAITASDRTLSPLAQGTTPPTALPGPVHLQVTLH